MLLQYNMFDFFGLKHRDRGFSLVELIVVMAIFTVAIAIAVSVFTSILGPSKQEAKIGEAQLESMVGVQMLITDIQNAGFGLPYTFGEQNILYEEAVSVSGVRNPANYNDAPNGVPRAILGNQILDPNYGTVSYLVLKGSAVAMNETSQRWSQIRAGGEIVAQANAGDQTRSGDQVIVLITQADPLNPQKDYRRLALNAALDWRISQTSSTHLPNDVAPKLYTDPSGRTYGGINLAYGIDTVALRMPFNRADYFISEANVPSTCAPRTGTLTKNTVNHANGALNSIPVLDCVASFQVFYGLSASSDTQVVSQYTADITMLAPQVIRETLREVRVHILMHEGRRDPNFEFSNFTGALPNSIRLGDSNINVDYVLTANQLNYRWKVLSFIVKPKNL